MFIVVTVSSVFAYTLGQKQVIVTLNSNVAVIDGKPVSLEAPPVIVKGKTMVPLRFIGEAFGAKVDWDNTTKSATLTVAEKECPPCPLHNDAHVFVGDKVTTAGQKSKLFHLENGACNISLYYYVGYNYDIVGSLNKPKTLKSAAITVNLYKDDGTLVKTFEALGQKERDKYAECMSKDKYGFCSIDNKTLFTNIDKGIYYFSVTAVVEQPDKDLWSITLDELSK